MHSQLCCICNLAENLGARHSGVTPVPQLAVKGAKSTSVPPVSPTPPLPLLVSAIPPSLSNSLPTHFLSFLTEYSSPPPIFTSHSFCSCIFLSLYHPHSPESRSALLPSSHSQKQRVRDESKGKDLPKYQTAQFGFKTNLDLPQCSIMNHELRLHHSPLLFNYIKVK